MKAIVTGADGFVGSEVVKELLRHHYEVLAIDLPETPRRLDLASKGLKYLSHSVADCSFFSEACQDKKYDVLFHFAWRGSGGPDRGNEEIQLENVIEAARTLRAASSVGVKRFVFASSIAEFETNDVTFAQGSQPDAHYIYGAAKGAAHQVLKPLANSLGIELVWAYITNCYGVGDFSNRFLNATLKKIISGERIEFTSGTQNYDFCYISDVANAFRLLGEKGQNNCAYVIGSGEAKPLRLFLEEMMAVLRPTNEIVFGQVPFTGVQAPLDNFDISRIEKDCGYKPAVPFKEGVAKTFVWLKGISHD
jgi:UDP-glucose 4-epimerase